MGKTTHSVGNTWLVIAAVTVLVCGDEYMYHLASDPGKIRNLANEDEHQAQKRRMFVTLEAWL